MQNDKFKKTYDNVQQERQAIQGLNNAFQANEEIEDSEMKASHDSDSGWEQESDESLDQIPENANKQESNKSQGVEGQENIRVY